MAGVAVGANWVPAVGADWDRAPLGPRGGAPLLFPLPFFISALRRARWCLNTNSHPAFLFWATVFHLML